MNMLKCIYNYQMRWREAMELNVEAIKSLIEKETGGNISKFSKMIGVSPDHLYQALFYKKSGGAKISGAIISFCESHNLDFRKYIFLR